MADAMNNKPAKQPKIEMNASRQFVPWMLEHKLSLAFTTYQTGKLFLIGLQPPDGRLSVFERTFERCMGLCSHNDSLYMSNLYQIWRFNNIVPTGQDANGYDRLYVPQASWVTGDVDAHDMAVDKNGRLIFVNTLFSCLATVDGENSFTPLWKPPFISKLAAEDRCHLNGLAMDAGTPRFVTAVSSTDVHEGWRQHRIDGGVVIDVASGETVASGFSMPHSPRMHNGKLWLLDSGNGDFGCVDIDTGKFEAVAFCPGYARGLAIHGDYALIGLSSPRGENKTFQGLPLDDRLEKAGVSAHCAIYVINLITGDVVHSLSISGVVEELYDVVALPGVIRPSALGFKSDEIRRTLNVGEMGSL